MPPAPVIVPLVAVKVPVPRPSRLMPSLMLLVELTASKASVETVVPVTSTAGPPVALTFWVPAARKDTVPALESAKAGVAPLVVVSARSPNVVLPVVLVMLTPPVPEPVTVMASNSLVPMFTPVAPPPVATRPAAFAEVIATLPAAAKVTVPALLSRTPVAPLVLTVRLETAKVPVVPSSSSPGWVPKVPVSRMLTSSMVALTSPVLPAIPPPAPLGSMFRPRTSLPSSRSITSAPVAVTVGCMPGLAGYRVSLPTIRPSCSPISRSPAFMV